MYINPGQQEALNEIFGEGLPKFPRICFSELSR